MYGKIMRRNKRSQITLVARLMAALMIAVLLIATEFIYILVVRPGRTVALAEENDNDTIIIPVSDGNSSSENETGETKEPSGNNAEKSEEPEEDPEEEPSPVVKITIIDPEGWHRKSATVKFTAEDTADTGDFVIKGVRAKIGQGGSWMDITDSEALELSENCSVYVEYKDTKDRTYSKNKKITCFDTTKPTLNAAVNNGSLSIDTNDDESGVKAVYVNGFEFTDLTEGSVNIRMQQFDTGYEYFAIQAMDNAGNTSDTYKVKNPYYKAKDASGKEKKVLPDSAEATKPASATATVTDHIKTDEAGNTLANLFSNALSSVETISGDSKSEEKKKALAEADRYEKSEDSETVPGKGREFYTIEAKSGKVFYLIIDRNGEEEMVHFVTDITENDLLNVTEDNSDTIPQNAASPEGADLITESALPNNNRQIDDPVKQEEISTAETMETEPAEEVSDDSAAGKEDKSDSNPLAVKLFLIIAGVLAGIAVFALKKFRKNRDGDYSEDEDEDPDNDETDYPDDEYGGKKSRADDFFNDPEEQEGTDSEDEQAESSGDEETENEPVE